MNNEIFQQARQVYAEKDFEQALGLFTACLQDPTGTLEPGEAGLIYHQIGNCLVKLNDYNEAIHAYTQATADSDYKAVGTVNCNLGMAYAALHDYENAVQHFEIAVSDAQYETPYKAHMGMGNAYLKLGKSAEAGAAFRAAALDEANPDPTKALLNLGVCFMALNRASDAVASYESALQFDMPAPTRNKLNANLGQAYVASGQMQKAVGAFEEALADKTYFLSDSASVDYQRAIAQVSTGTAEMQPVDLGADMSGLDVTADGSPVYSESDQLTQALDPYYYPDTYDMPQDGYASGDDRFFNASDEELERWSKGVAKQERKRRNIGLKFLVFVIVILLLAFAAGVFAYSQGYGYPTQETVVTQLFADPDNASAVFSPEIPSESIEQKMAPIQQDSNIVIDGVERSMANSEVYVTASTEEGGDVPYRVSLVRDGIGWKVTDIQLYFASQN